MKLSRSVAGSILATPITLSPENVDVPGWACVGRDAVWESEGCDCEEDCCEESASSGSSFCFFQLPVMLQLVHFLMVFQVGLIVENFCTIFTLILVLSLDLFVVFPDVIPDLLRFAKEMVTHITFEFLLQMKCSMLLEASSVSKNFATLLPTFHCDTALDRLPNFMGYKQVVVQLP